MKKSNHLFILSNGRVAAIDKKTGGIVWEVRLKQYLNRSVSMYFGQISGRQQTVYRFNRHSPVPEHKGWLADMEK